MSDKRKMSPEIAAVNGYNIYSECVSGARQAMLSGNLSQNNVIYAPTRNRHRSGLENEFAKGCWALEFEDDSTVIEVIPRFTSRVYGESFDLNPLDIVIIEQASTGLLHYLSLPRYHSMHPQYGFSYTYDDEVYGNIRKGARFSKGTKVARSPGVTEDGDWMAGREVNVAVVTHAAGIEDGILIREGCANWLRARGIEKRIGTCGRKHYPINSYGKKGEFKIFPDIGETIDTNGLLFALRPFDERLDPIYMTENRLKSTIYNFDKPTFCQPQARSDITSIDPEQARVIDIKVFHNAAIKNPKVPPHMTEQLQKYLDADKQFYLKIIKACLGRDGAHGWSKLAGKLTPELNTLVTYGIRVCGDLLVKEGLWNKKLIHELQLPASYRGEELDEWRWEITFEYLSPIGVGPKVTDVAGSANSLT